MLLLQEGILNWPTVWIRKRQESSSFISGFWINKKRKTKIELAAWMHTLSVTCVKSTEKNQFCFSLKDISHFQLISTFKIFAFFFVFKRFFKCYYGPIKYQKFGHFIQLTDIFQRSFVFHFFLKTKLSQTFARHIPGIHLDLCNT